MQINVEKLGQALDGVMDAAVDYELWLSFLENIATATGSFGALIMPLARRTESSAIATPNLNEMIEEYFRVGWANNDWNIHARPLLQRDGIARSQQFAPPEGSRSHDFFRFLARHGLGNACLIEWYAVPNDPLCLVLHRKLDQPPFTNDEAALLITIRNRLMAAARMAYQVSQNRVAGAILGLDIARMPAIFVDRLGKITHVNGPAAEVMGADLHVRGDELRASDEGESERIRLAVQAMLSQSGESASENVQRVAIVRNGQNPLLLRIQRLSGEMDLFAHSVGLCVINVPEKQRTAPPHVLKQAFALTEQEAAIAALLCEGHSLREISEATGRSYETVRTHMKSILQKTGTSRQGELIALVAKMKMLQ